ncbi:MAG TPA: hypothetical protein VFB41_08715 [Solirubrobacteraceae bacterium]|nr:hypothetical protein [Solirubrobacteraceae bacterium]
MSARRRNAMCLAALVAAFAVAPAAAIADIQPPTLIAAGSAQVKPTPVDRNSDASIRKAVEDAEEKALPAAVKEARSYAAKLATAGQVRLGPLQSISNLQSQQFAYPFGPPGQNGTFPGGHFCGQVSNTRTVIVDGKRRRVGKGTRRVCRVPASVSASVSLTFTIVP